MVIWSIGTTLEQHEKEILFYTLRYFQGNKTKTAQSLGISVRTIDNKLAKYEKEEQERKQRQQ